MGPTGSLNDLTERLRTSLWFTPLVMVTCTVAVFVLLLRLDEHYDEVASVFEFTGDPSAARDVASTIAGAMMGFIGIVFSITVLALQLASSQFSPRALRGFLRDRITKLTLGTFVSALVYALLTMHRVDGAAVSVPDLTMTALFGFTLASIVIFIVYIDHIAHAIRVVNILESIAHENSRDDSSDVPRRSRRDRSAHVRTVRPGWPRTPTWLEWGSSRRRRSRASS